MHLSQAFKMAFSAVWSNKMRSFLTMLGVIIGVMAVTLLITLGQSAGDVITGEITSLGSDLVVVSVFSQRDYTITLDELEELEQTEYISYVTPVITANNVTIKGGGEDDHTSIEGVLPQYAIIRQTNVTSGRFINEGDIEHRSNVAVVGIEVCDNLFGHTEVLGETITMLGRRFTIIGILEEKGTTMVGNEDNRIIIPLTTGQRALRIKRPPSYYFSATNSDVVNKAQDDIETFFLQKVKDKDDYYIMNQSQILSIVDTAMSTITGMLAGIAAISLLVGGIGIMNIMLVSVTERTREIGIRKAIGAKRRNILSQFLIESAVISLGGGLIGLGLSIGIGRILQNIINLQLNFSLNTILLALGFSIVVGIGFGMYPANKASKLNPIEALRYE